MPTLRRQPTLLEKSRISPGIPVSELLSSARAALERAKADFIPYLRNEFPNIDRLFLEAARSGLSPETWDTLYIAAHDLRSCSASAGANDVSAVASSLERLLQGGSHDDPRAAEVIRLHMDAIRLLIGPEPPASGSEEMVTLLVRLGDKVDAMMHGSSA